MRAWLDGKMVDWREITVSPLSHGFSRGMAIFEVALVVRTQKGPSIFMHDDHLDRFYTSAKLAGMALPVARDELREVCRDLVRADGTQDGTLKYFAYNPTPAAKAVPDDPQVSVAIFCGSDRDFGQSHDHPVAPQLAGISRFRKPHWETVPIKAKITGNYVNACLATQEVMARGYSTPILLDVEGFVTEGGTQSQFFVHQGVLKTAPLARILAGTTRRVVLDVAREAGIPVEETDIRPEELPAMEEAFCSGSVSRLVPIRAIDGRALAGPCPGPITTRLVALMDQVYACARPEYAKYHCFV